MSAFPAPPIRARNRRWVLFLLVVLLTQLGLWIGQSLPTDLPLLVAAHILPASEQLSWYLTRSSGAVAYMTLTLSTVWGLLLSTKLVKAWVPGALALTMHNTLAWIAIGLSCFHAFVLLFDHYYTYTIANLLVPFTGPYAPGWVGVGTLSFYLLLLVSTSFYARQWIGAKSWRRLHYLTFGAFLMVTLHGWMAGTDSTQLTPIYLVSGNLVLFLTCYRIIDGIQTSRTQRQQPNNHQRALRSA